MGYIEIVYTHTIACICPTTSCHMKYCAMCPIIKHYKHGLNNTSNKG